MTDWTPEEDEAFNEVERHSNLGKQILRDIEGQPYHFEKREWVGLTDGEVDKMILLMGFPPDWITENAIVKNIVRNLEAKLKEKNT